MNSLLSKLRKLLLALLQAKTHEEMLVWLQSPDVQIARQAASNAMYGYNPSKEQDPCRRMELAYNRAQRDGCKMSGWPLHMIIYLETAEVTKLYAKRAVN